jgi:hypothetical protein
LVKQLRDCIVKGDEDNLKLNYSKIENYGSLKKKRELNLVYVTCGMSDEANPPGTVPGLKHLQTSLLHESGSQAGAAFCPR